MTVVQGQRLMGWLMCTAAFAAVLRAEVGHALILTGLAWLVWDGPNK